VVPTFPVSERVELKAPPLELVVCQLRFPAVLALEAQPPVEFQKGMKKDYPVAHRPQAATLGLRPEPGFQLSLSKYWAFEDKESKWTVSLGHNFLSLETKHYRRFEEFLDRFRSILKFACELYPIELRERLGLRYVDRISRSREPRLPADWSNKVRSEIIPLRSLRAEGESQLANLETRFVKGDRVLAIRSAYVDGGFPGASEEELVLDFDCYTEKRAELNGLDEILRSYRAELYNAFRWALKDMFTAYEPAGAGGQA